MPWKLKQCPRKAEPTHPTPHLQIIPGGRSGAGADPISAHVLDIVSSVRTDGESSFDRRSRVQLGHRLPQAPGGAPPMSKPRLDETAMRSERRESACFRGRGEAVHATAPPPESGRPGRTVARTPVRR